MFLNSRVQIVIVPQLVAEVLMQFIISRFPEVTPVANVADMLVDPVDVLFTS